MCRVPHQLQSSSQTLLLWEVVILRSFVSSWTDASQACSVPSVTCNTHTWHSALSNFLLIIWVNRFQGCVITCSSRLIKTHLQAEQTILSDTSLTRLPSACLSFSGLLLSSRPVWAWKWRTSKKRIKDTGFNTNIKQKLVHTYSLPLAQCLQAPSGWGSPPSVQKHQHLSTSQRWSGNRHGLPSCTCCFITLPVRRTVTEKNYYCIFGSYIPQQ